MTLLIAEDDPALALFLGRAFEADGCRVRVVSDGVKAVEVFRDEVPDLTILDLNLPKKDGESALDEMRQLNADRPILVLTGRTDLQSRVRCIEHGADDLLQKPFSMVELRARCGALLRRRTSVNALLKIEDLEVDRMSRAVKRGGNAVELTNKEFALLEQLMLNRGACLSRSELLQRIWKSETTQTTNIVDVYVNYLRRKLDDRPPGSIIRTIHGRGYMITSSSGLQAGFQAAD
ncbi:response regulator transcription factor [Occallatibacter savannae]|uniref:response regulator transcription factor n=1 Tax=Occallatibacter savannae TaxID=1002691 RepID=UPI000D68BD6A|nr:response regulator transcription factor [Occallatibacter savannae]